MSPEKPKEAVREAVRGIRVKLTYRNSDSEFEDSTCLLVEKNNKGQSLIHLDLEKRSVPWIQESALSAATHELLRESR
jgi:hypothetical protein